MPKPNSKVLEAEEPVKAAQSTPRRRALKGLRLRPGLFDDDWRQFVEDVSAKIQQSINLQALNRTTPNDEPFAVLKRLVYEFYLRYRKTVRGIDIQAAIENYRFECENRKSPKDRGNIRRLQKKFKDSYFYWILTGIASGLQIGEFAIKKDHITRFSQQLIYARRHKVPPEYLTGFLYQSGTISEVCTKSKDKDRREDWYVSNNKR